MESRLREGKLIDYDFIDTAYSLMIEFKLPIRI
jgi:hypothetical protein